MRPLRESDDIEDENNPAISHDGGSAIGVDALQVVTQGLHDNFLSIENVVHDESESPRVGLQDNNVGYLGPALESGAEV